MREPRTGGRRLSMVLYLALLLGYCWLRLAHAFALQEVKAFPDSVGYLTPWNRNILFPSRPWTIPLVYQMLGRAPDLIFAAQLALSVTSWTILAAVVARTLRCWWLQHVGFGLVLLFSLSHPVIMWDGLILSDSISLSLMILAIAASLWLLEGWRVDKVLVLGSLVALWAFARDANAWVLLFAAPLPLLAGMARSRRRWWVVATMCVLLFAASAFSASRARRWEFPFLTVLAQRVLPDAGRTAYFARLGMPVSDALMARTGKFAWSDNNAFLRDPALREFRVWLHARGQRSYMRFLIAHPSWTLVQPIADAKTLLAPQLRYYIPSGFVPILPGWVADAIYPERITAAWLWMSAAAAMILGSVAVGTSRPAWPVALLLVGVAYPHAALVWHADSNDIGRHAVQMSVHYRLGLWLLLVLAIDGVCHARVMRPAAMPQRGIATPTRSPSPPSPAGAPGRSWD